MQGLSEPDERTCELIDIHVAVSRIMETYLSKRHTREFILEALNKGIIRASGTLRTDGTLPRTCEPIQVAPICKGFWQSIDPDWDDPNQGLRNGVFTASNYEFYPGQLSDIADDHDDEDSRPYLSDHTTGDGRDQTTPLARVITFERVKVDWNEIEVLLESPVFRSDFTRHGIKAFNVTTESSTNVGRPRSPKWDTWIGSLAYLAFHRKINRKSTANAIIERVIKDLAERDEDSPSNSVVQSAAKSVVDNLQRDEPR